MYEFNLVLLLLQQMCVFLVIAWLMSKTRLFIPLMQVTVRLPHKFLCYVVFSIFCIMGTWFGLHIEDSIANTRAIGAVMGGLLGGPVVGGLVGLTGGSRWEPLMFVGHTKDYADTFSSASGSFGTSTVGLLSIRVTSSWSMR